MCEANACPMDGELNQLIMKAVDSVEPEGDGIKSVNIFGGQKIVRARIHTLSLVDHKVCLKKL